MGPSTQLQEIASEKETCFNVTFKGQEVVKKICIDLTLSDGRAFGSSPKVVRAKSEKFNQYIEVPVPNKDIPLSYFRNRALIFLTIFTGLFQNEEICLNKNLV